MADLVRQTQLDKDKAALANPQSAEQVMDIGDRASRLHKALKGMKGFEEEYYKAFEVMIEAYRIVGIELLAIEKAAGARGQGHGPRLSDLGITKNQSSEWQTIALVPPTDIEEYVKSKRTESASVTKAAILEIARNYKSALQICIEESIRVIGAMNSLCIQGATLITHLRKYPDTRSAIPEDFFKQLKLCEEVLDQLNKSTL